MDNTGYNRTYLYHTLSGISVCNMEMGRLNMNYFGFYTSQLKKVKPYLLDFESAGQNLWEIKGTKCPG